MKVIREEKIETIKTYGDITVTLTPEEAEKLVFVLGNISGPDKVIRNTTDALLRELRLQVYKGRIFVPSFTKYEHIYHEPMVVGKNEPIR